MSVVDPSGKEAVRRREPEERGAGTYAGGVASLVRVLDESRLKPKAKEQEVLDVATEYFLQHGYRGASINAMARSSGISKESIYRYFSSKQQLFEAVIGRELIEYRRSLHRLDATLRSMDLRAALITVAETILGIITTDRTLALRRLIFDEATRSPEVGQHYYKIGPGQGYAVLEAVFETHAHQSDFDIASLARYFAGLLSWRVTMERQCAVRPQPTPEENAALAATMVDDFMKAFLRPK
ncbi:MAG TPA: TetR/AcrR family transcriptional regulator [Gammaproteobacteria bacterium]|nr:TetR/AcrR family transcriptional regulator [Gammaproteobacteria bacterium]